MECFRRRRIGAIALLAVLTTVASAQEATTSSGGSGSQATTSATGEGAHSVYKSQVFVVKHRRPRSLVEVLQPLRSGTSGTDISPSDEFGTISVRDFPENIATIGEAIKRLDVAEPARADVDLHLHVLLASQNGPSVDLPPEIKNAIGQLQNTLSFKSFTLLAPIVQRTREGSDGFAGTGEVSDVQIARSGSADVGHYFVAYSYGTKGVSQSTDSSGTTRLDLEHFVFELTGQLGKARIESNLSLRDGEQVVVGTAMLRNGQALVLVLSAKGVK